MVELVKAVLGAWLMWIGAVVCFAVGGGIINMRTLGSRWPQVAFGGTFIAGALTLFVLAIIRVFSAL